MAAEARAADGAARGFGKAAATAPLQPQDPSLSAREERLRLLGECLVVSGLLTLLICLLCWQGCDPGLAFDGYIDVPQTLLGLDSGLDALVSSGPLANKLSFPKGYAFFDVVVSVAAISALLRQRRAMMLALLVFSFLPFGVFGINVPLIRTGGWIILTALVVQAFRRGDRQAAAGWAMVFAALFWLTGQPFMQVAGSNEDHSRVWFSRLQPPAETKPVSIPSKAAATPTVGQGPAFTSFRMLSQPPSFALSYALAQEAFFRRDMSMLAASMPDLRDNADRLSAIGRARLAAMEYVLASEQNAPTAPIMRHVLFNQAAAWLSGIASGLLLAGGYGLQFLAGKILDRIKRMKGLSQKVKDGRSKAIAERASGIQHDQDQSPAFLMRLLMRRIGRARLLAMSLLAAAVVLALPSYLLPAPPRDVWPAFSTVHLMPAVLPLIPDGTYLVYGGGDERISFGGAIRAVFWGSAALLFFVLLLRRRYGLAARVALATLMLQTFLGLLPPQHGLNEIAYGKLPATLRSALLQPPADTEESWQNSFAAQAYPYVRAQIAYMDGDAGEAYRQLSRLEPDSWQANPLALWRSSIMSEWLAGHGYPQIEQQMPDLSFQTRRAVLGIMQMMSLMSLTLAVLPALLWLTLSLRRRRLMTLLDNVVKSAIASRVSAHGGFSAQSLEVKQQQFS